MGKLYTCGAIEGLAEKYVNKGGELVTIEEGTLGYGLSILLGDGLKTTVIQEVPLNEWSSAHKVRMYNKTPQKYFKMLKKLDSESEEN